MVLICIDLILLMNNKLKGVLWDVLLLLMTQHACFHGNNTAFLSSTISQSLSENAYLTVISSVQYMVIHCQLTHSHLTSIQDLWTSIAEKCSLCFLRNTEIFCIQSSLQRPLRRGLFSKSLLILLHSSERLDSLRQIRRITR